MFHFVALCNPRTAALRNFHSDIIREQSWSCIVFKSDGFYNWVFNHGAHEFPGIRSGEKYSKHPTMTVIH